MAIAIITTLILVVILIMIVERIRALYVTDVPRQSTFIHVGFGAVRTDSNNFPKPTVRSGAFESIIICPEDNPWQVNFICVLPVENAILNFSIAREDLEELILDEKALPKEFALKAKVEQGRIEFELPTIKTSDGNSKQIFLSYDQQDLKETVQYLQIETEAERSILMDENLEAWLTSQK